MTKYVQTLSAKLDKAFAQVNDHLIVFVATVVFTVLAKSLGILP